MTCICRYLTLTTSFVDRDINDEDIGLKAKKDAITIDKSTEGDKRQDTVAQGGHKHFSKAKKCQFL